MAEAVSGEGPVIPGGSAPPPPVKDRSRAIFLWVSAIGVTLIVLAAAEILLPFILAVTVAFILLPAVLFVERRRVPRWIAILLVYAVALGSVAAFFAVAIPSVVREVKSLQREFPSRVKYIEENWLPSFDRKLVEWQGNPKSGETAKPNETAETVVPAPPLDDDDGPSRPPPALVVHTTPDGSYEVSLGDHVQIRRVNDDIYRIEPVEKDEEAVSSKALLRKVIGRGEKYLAENAGEVVRFGQAVIGAVWKTVFTLFMTLMLAGYIMLTHESILRFFRELVKPEERSSFDRLLHRLEKGLAGVVRGQLIICLVNGVLAAIGFWLFDLKYWPIMAILAAVGSIIPIFGSVLSAIPAVVIGLTQSVGTAVEVLAWIVGIHQLEANFLNPKIIGDSAKIHPVLVVFALLAGEHFFQIKGALFAVPCLSILQTLFLHFRERTTGLADPTVTAAPTPSKRAGLFSPKLDKPSSDP